MKIVSWQSVVTDHQTHMLRALQEEAKEPILIVSGAKELKERKQQGWSMPNLADLDVCYLESRGWWRQGLKVLSEHKDAIHIFNGLWGDRRFFPLIVIAQRRGLKTVLVTEPYSHVATGYLTEDNSFMLKVKTFLRPWLYKFAGGLVAKRFDAVFAISDRAVMQFEKIGVPTNIIFPFGYFVPRVETKGVSSNQSRKPSIRLIYVGSLIPIKGITTLVEAMKVCGLKGLDIALDVYGHGDATFFASVASISYKGIIPFGRAQEVISEYDVLILPSLYDGWGVVVNESLLQGVPVIVSNQVGAKALVEKSGAGEIVEADDTSALFQCLESICYNPGILKLWKRRAKMACLDLSPEYAAQYMIERLVPIASNDKKEGGI